jgi:hypothetical protein
VEPPGRNRKESLPVAEKIEPKCADANRPDEADPFHEEEFTAVTSLIFDLVRRCAAGHRHALGRLSWALGKAALQAEDTEAGEVFLAVAGTLETPGDTLLHELHPLARRALLRAQDRQIPNDILKAYGAELWVEIDNKTALGRALGSEIEYMRAPHEPPYTEEEQVAGVVAILRIGQRRIGILPGISEQELAQRVAGAFKKGLSDDVDRAATTILYTAGMSYKDAHNLVNAAKNKAAERKGTDDV